MKKTSAELKRCAREILTGSYTVPVASCFITTAISTILLLPFYVNSISSNSRSQNGIYYLASIIIMLIEVIFSCGLTYLHLNMARKNPYQFSNILYGFRNHPQKIAGSYLLLFLMEMLPLLPGTVFLIFSLTVFSKSLPFMGITVLLFLAGIVWTFRIGLQYSLIFCLLVDHPEITIREIFALSKNLMEGNKLRLLYINLSFIGFAFLGAISFGIGRLWITPYITQTRAVFFLNVLDEKTDIF